MGRPLLLKLQNTPSEEFAKSHVLPLSVPAVVGVASHGSFSLAMFLPDPAIIYPSPILALVFLL